MASRAPIRNYRFSVNFYITPGVQLLIIANFAVYILEAFVHYFGGINGYNWLLKWFGLVPAGVIPLFRIWQPFTYLFLHDVTTIWHVLTNMFMLWMLDRKSTRLNSSHLGISYAVFCLKKKNISTKCMQMSIIR